MYEHNVAYHKASTWRYRAMLAGMRASGHIKTPALLEGAHDMLTKTFEGEGAGTMSTHLAATMIVDGIAPADWRFPPSGKPN